MAGESKVRENKKLGIVIFSLIVLISIGTFVWSIPQIAQRFGFGSESIEQSEPKNISLGVPNIDMAFVEPLPSDPSVSFVNNVVVATAKPGVRIEQVSSAAESIGGKIVGRVSLIRVYYIEVESQTEESLLMICTELMNTGLFSSVSLDIIDWAGIDLP